MVVTAVDMVATAAGTATARGPLTPSPRLMLSFSMEVSAMLATDTPASAMLVMAMAHTPTTTATARGPLTPSLRPTTAAATATVMAAATAIVDTVATGATATAGGMAVMVMAAGTTGKLKNRRTELS